MKEDLLKLVELETLDYEIYQLKRRKDEFPILLEACQKDEDALKAGLAALKEKFKTIELDRKSKEIEIESNEAQIKKNDNQLTQIKKNDEYKAMLHQIEELKKKNDKLEEGILIQMDALDEVQTQIKQEDIKVQEAMAGIKTRRDDIQSVQSSLDQDTRALEEKRSKCVDTVTPRVRDIYLQVLHKRKDRALASIKEDTCGACHMVLMPQVIEKSRLGEEVVCCDTCSRILYHPDLLARLKTADAEV